jgi:hypothetical protein
MSTMTALRNHAHERVFFGAHTDLNLLPVEMVPDFNRDGVIDDKDRGKVTETEPWRWWVNDDNDNAETEGNDLPGGGSNFGDARINGVRDLIDWFPVSLEIGSLVDVLPPASYTYELRSSDSSMNILVAAMGTVGVKITESNVRTYLRSRSTAETLVNPIVQVLPLTPKTVLSDDFINEIKTDRSGVILVEARTATAASALSKLELHVISKTSGQDVCQVKLPMRFSSVEKMFRHKDLLSVNGASGGRGDYKVGAGEEPENYPDKLCVQKNFVFLHGYNVNAQQARGWQAETFKRLHQSGSKAKFVGVTWYGSETQEQTGGQFTPNYHLNVDNAFATAQPLKTFLAGLSGEKVVAAHSLGNMVVSSTLHDWQGSFAKYFAIDAAMAIEAVDGRPEFMNNDMVHLEWDNPNGQGKYPERLWASEWHKLFSDERGKLTWRDRLEQLDGATVYNFYSSGEEVLDTHPHGTAPAIPDIATDGIGRYAWALQEKLKGRTSSGAVLGSNTGGWGFSSAYDTTRDGNGNPTYPLTLPSPAETAQITDAQLRVEPFFRAKTIVSIDLPPELFGANGSQYAQQHRNTLLSQAFPSRTLPVGSHEVRRFGDRNLNMNTSAFQSGWPRTDTDWHHSDMREVAYLFTYKLFDKFVELGGLKQ